MMFFFLLGFALVITSHAYDYYDVNEVYNEFIVDCGTAENPYMRITYGGDAYAVYAADAPLDCRAQEVAPAVFLLEIMNYNEEVNCPVVSQTAGSTPINTLDVVVQAGTVRQWDDGYKQITCNYGLGGRGITSDTDTDEGNVNREPVWDMVGDMAINDTVSLYVFDTDNQVVTTAVLGNYIQLRAFLTSDSNSIRVFNCRGYSLLMSYYILIGGCGEGDVMALNRGFRTRFEAQDVVADARRVARSSYFKSFLLPGSDSIVFECDYILCADEFCDEYSCPNSVMLGYESPGRRKRQAGVSTAVAEIPFHGSIPKVQTSRIQILPQPSQEQYVISSADLIRAEGSNPTSPAMRSAWDQKIGPKKEKAGVSMMTVGLIVGMAFLSVLLVITLTCTIIVCRRSLRPVGSYHEDSMLSPMFSSLKQRPV